MEREWENIEKKRLREANAFVGGEYIIMSNGEEV